MARIILDPLLNPVFRNPKFFFDRVEGWIDRYSMPPSVEENYVSDGSGLAGRVEFSWRDYVEGVFPDTYFPIFPTGPNAKVREVHLIEGTNLNAFNASSRVQSDTFVVEWSDDNGASITEYVMVRFEVDTPMAVDKFYGQSMQDFLKGNDVIYATDNNDIVDGFAGNDTLLGFAGDDTLLGGLGDDVLDDGLGTNVLNGGRGNDTYEVDISGFDASSDGMVLVNSITDTAGVDKLKMVALVDSGDAYLNLRRTGLGGKDFSIGIRSGDHWIADQDTWYTKTTIVDQYAYGRTGYSGALETLSLRGPDQTDAQAEIVNIGPASGSTATRINGTNAADVLMGFGSGNTLNGNGGDDYLTAGRLDSPEELLMAKVLVGGVATSLTGWLVREGDLPSGFSLDQLNELMLDSANSGSALFIPNMADAGLLVGDALSGGAGSDYLNGYYGNDTLDGGTGVDILAGWEGSDTYVVDDIRDEIVETSDDGLQDKGGLDTVSSSEISLDLNDYQYVENAKLTGSKRLNLKGDSQDNLLSGNGSNNSLDGGVGDDTLMGGAGNDIYRIQEFQGGNDVVSDSGGTDTLEWEDFNGDNYVQFTRLGNDLSIRTYALANRDELNEWVYSDTGLVQTTTVVNFWGTGFIENFLTKNPSDPAVLLKFAKSFSGTNNNELFLGTDRADVIKSLGGIDIIWAGDGNDLIDAGAGDDQIEGGLGSDTLTGGLGADVFMFNAVSDSTNASWDLIRDFSRAQGDRIGLHYIDENVNQFGNGRFAFAETAANYSVWTSSNGRGGLFVFGDINGDASADLKVELLGVTRLESSDFIL